MGKKKTNITENLLRLDIKIDGRPIYLKDDFGIYNVMVMSSKPVDKEDDDSIIKANIEYSTVVGNFAKKMFDGEEYIMYGEQANHPKFGLQYKIKFVKEKFDTPARVRVFIKQFVAESIANQLIEKYGSELIQRIVDNDVDYSDIYGMADYRFNALREKVMENEFMRDIIMSFSEFSLTANQVGKIVALFGGSSVEKIKENPYNLCKVQGIGFLKADEVAKSMGYPVDSEHRIDEAIKYTISEMQKDGNSWMSRVNLISDCTELLDIDPSLIEDRVDKVEDVYVEDTKVTLQHTYNAEKYIASKLSDILKNSNELEFSPDDFIKEQMDKYGVTLTDEQQKFFYDIQKYNVNFLVGYAGCGKSYLQKLLMDLADTLNIGVLLLCPTGKGAKVMEGYTGRKAFTIHRALGAYEGKKSEDNQIWEDLIIVDESSMADVYIIQRLLLAIKNPKARVVFVGDDFQIPSVGVGLFLHDCIESGKFPVTKLTKVFRQQEGGVLDIATKIRTKTRFIDDKFFGRKIFGSDLVYHAVEQNHMEKGYVHYYKKALEKFSAEDIVVLSPTKKGNLGVPRINREIQSIVNPPSSSKKEVKYGRDEIIYRVGDRVINMKNNYKAINESGEEVTVVNGDIGVIVDIVGIEVIIDYGFDIIKTPFNQLELISHAYALTIHKAQGSGFPCVIIVTDKAHKFQLNANLIYTAFTRTQKFACIVCQSDVINSSMRKNVNMQRNTFLKNLLVA